MLTVAEVCALGNYRAVRVGAADRMTRAVAARILGDEECPMPFHVRRLRADLAHLPAPARLALATAWWALFVPSAAVVAVDHRAALRLVGVPARRYFVGALGAFAPVSRAVLGVPAWPGGPVTGPPPAATGARRVLRPTAGR